MLSEHLTKAVLSNFIYTPATKNIIPETVVHTSKLKKQQLELIEHYKLYCALRTERFKYSVLVG